MTTRSTPGFKNLLDFAHDLADLSGPAILRYFRRPIAVDNKQGDGGFDPVTAADRGAERIILQALKAHFPDHGLIGEEHGTRNATARHRWIVDPIDGTRSFIMGQPLWGTLIGLMDGEDPVLGLMDQPYTGERFWSGEKASYLRDASGKVRKLITRTCPSLDHAIVATTHPDLFAKGAETKGFLKVKDAARMTRYGGDCYNYAMLAAGFVDVVIEAGLKGFDIVALIPIIERAGGRVTTWDGGPATSGGRILACGDPAMHARLVEMLGG